MSWNYRVIRRSEIYYDDLTRSGSYKCYEVFIHEVYYDESGNIIGWSENAATITGHSKEELRGDLNLFNMALNKPILEEVDGKLVEVED
jgi:hypothetical protein